jgi:hypothetical protein
MPQTRRARAYQLLNDVARGPASLNEKDKANYNLWVSTWILPKIVELIPELKGSEIKVCTAESQHKINLPGYTTKVSA